MIRAHDDLPETSTVEAPRSHRRPLPTETCPCCHQRVIWHPPRITAAQLRVLRAFRDLRPVEGGSASLAEVAEYLGLSKVTVLEHVSRLCDQGVMRRQQYVSRSIVVIYDPDSEEGHGGDWQTDGRVGRI